jgi:HlyD family secretion protein
LLILGSWFFRYPDVVPSKIVVTTENPPAPIVAKATGKIDHLLVGDKQNVERGQALAVIENTGSYKDILKLDSVLKDFDERIQSAELSGEWTEKSYELGDVQPKYSLFLKRFEDYEHFLQLDYHQRKIASLEDEMRQAKQHYQELLGQKTTLEQEYKLAQRQFERDSVLFEKEVIPEAEYEASETRLLNKRYSLEQIDVSISSARVQLSRIEQNILELELQDRRQRSQLQSSLMESYDNLKAAIDEWKRKYYLESPISGKVTFTRYWSENQHVETGKRVMTVIPANEGEIIGKMTLPFRGAGKVKVGQTVNIEFANYPPMEYGMVKGVVRSISLVPENQSYTVEVGLPNGLTTFYGEELEFSQQMQGRAEVITQDTRLLERIVRPLRYVVNKSMDQGKP